MIFKIIFLFFYVVLIETAYEGESCVKDGVNGVCRNLKKCQSAIEDIKSRRNPQTCSYDGADVIVCCLDRNTASFQRTTTRRPPVTFAHYYPSSFNSHTSDESKECEDVPLSITAKKTGRKAFDKCIEYQEKYVYPCEQGTSLLGDFTRNLHCHHKVDELIIGGVDAEQYEFPHMVMIGYGNLNRLLWLCGGALISDRFILTAAHCLTNNDIGPATYVLIGALRRSESTDRSKVYKVKKNILHPEYESPNKYHDIALLEIEKPHKLDQFTVPACLHTGDPVNDEKVLASGWGLTHHNGTIPAETLQKVILDKFSTYECSQKFQPSPLMKLGFDGRTQLCYGDAEVKKDTSFGDSGGPVQIKSKKIQCMYTVVGVTSFGSRFIGKPAIYTRVASYIPWIEGIVWPN